MALSAAERAVYERTRAQLESAVAHAGLGRGRVRYASAAKRKQCALSLPVLPALHMPSLVPPRLLCAAPARPSASSAQPRRSPNLYP